MFTHSLSELLERGEEMTCQLHFQNSIFFLQPRDKGINQARTAHVLN